MAGWGQTYKLPRPSEVSMDDTDKRPYSPPRPRDQIEEVVHQDEVEPTDLVVVANNVVVVYNAEKKFSTAALDIAINSHAKVEGDTILVLAYLEKFRCDFGTLMIADVEGESIRSANLTAITKAVGQAKTEIATLCQRSGHSVMCRKKNIKLLVKVVPGANPKEKVTKEITDQKATCVIFDKNIITSKKDKEYYTKKLSLPIFHIGNDGRSVETINSFGQAIPAEESTRVVPGRSSVSSEGSMEASPSMWSKLKSLGGSKRITGHRRDSSGGSSLRTNSSYGSSRTEMHEESDFEDHYLQ